LSKQSEIRYPSDSLVASEIARQPVLWPTTVQRVLTALGDRRFSGLPVILTGAGTSAYAAASIAEAWPGARAIPTTDLLLQSAAEIELAVPSIAQGGMLISLARSGDSPESVGVVARFLRIFPAVQHLAIVCNAEGRLAHTPRVEAICLDPGTNDRSLAMTSSFSNLVLGGLTLLHGHQVAGLLPKICSEVSDDLVSMNAAAAQIAAWCDDRIVVLASGMHALAQEACLKIVEMTAGRVMAMPESFLGLRHGPIAFLRESTPILCFASSDAGKRRYERDLVDGLKQRGLGRVIVVGNSDCSSWQHDLLVSGSAWDLPDSLRTPFAVVFAQLIAYQLSVRAHVDPDNPSPEGTLTRVVRPFRIHPEQEGL
jgi:tagatose-6-phosphate ketose/aldose isomerase